jgi:hypothetical protein
MRARVEAIAAALGKRLNKEEWTLGFQLSWL